MGHDGADLTPRLTLLESPLAEADLNDVEAAELVAFGLTAWSDWWASKALDWVDQGAWSEGVAEALSSCSLAERYSQATRHRARGYIKQRP